MVFDFMGLFDSIGLFWQSSKTNELSNDDGTLSQYRQPRDLEAETKKREQERACENRREQMREKRRQQTNTQYHKLQRR